MSRILVIPDLHSPFILKGYFEFVKNVRRKWKTDTTVFLGDIFDFHVVSRHLKSPDADGAKEEYNKALKELQKWYKEFPRAFVCVGNHDARLYRQGAEVAIPTTLLPTYKEWTKCPKGWDWAMEHEIDGAIYMHGTASKFNGQGPHVQAAKTNMQNTVIGHYHTLFGVSYLANKNQLVFGAIGGCGMDSASYAAKYAEERLVKPVVGCLVILPGSVVVTIPMPLGARIKRSKDVKKR
jgi:predicted phosphodiesterase